MSAGLRTAPESELEWAKSARRDAIAAVVHSEGVANAFLGQ